MRACCLTLLLLGGCGRIAFDPRTDGNAMIDAGDVQFASVLASNGYTCVRSTRGEVACWGINGWGKLGIGDTMRRGDLPGQIGPSLPRPTFGTLATPIDIVGTSDCSCALLSDHTAKCWGNNDGAQLGTGDRQSRGDMPGEMGDQLPTVQLAAGTQITGLAIGHYHGCAIVAGSVRCWGLNDVSQLGYGDGVPRDSIAQLSTLPAVDLGAGFEVAQITSGFNHTCALSTAKAIKCWGYQPNGELGVGDTALRGDAPSDMGAALPIADVGGAPDVVEAGNGYTCALIGDRAKCWGANNRGQLGLGDTMNRGATPGTMGTALPFIDLGTNASVTAISARNHTCALLAGGDVKCWGANDVGQLGLGDTTDRGGAAGMMGDALPRVPLPGPARAISAGSGHTCAILVSGGLMCWGSNDSGELGLGDTQNRGDQPDELDGQILPTQLWPDP